MVYSISRSTIVTDTVLKQAYVGEDFVFQSHEMSAIEDMRSYLADTGATLVGSSVPILKKERIMITPSAVYSSAAEAKRDWQVWDPNATRLTFMWKVEKK